MARHLLAAWSGLRGRFRSARHLALLLDFDGTLVPLQTHPDEVYLAEPERQLLGQLASHPRVTACVISGRRVADLRRRISLSRIHYLGLHGWEKAGEVLPADGAKLVNLAKRRMAKELGHCASIRLEDKGRSFVVHFRGAAAPEVTQARAIVRKTLASFRPHLRVLPGKSVWEILPRAAADKGRAARALLAGLPAGTLALYLGDDMTDESAFRALPDAVTARVGFSSQSRARFWLRSPREVWSFLRRLEAEIQ